MSDSFAELPVIIDTHDRTIYNVPYPEYTDFRSTPKLEESGRIVYFQGNDIGFVAAINFNVLTAKSINIKFFPSWERFPDLAWLVSQAPPLIRVTPLWASGLIYRWDLTWE